jgi:L-aminopeptidase/D-esterase-like protein
MSYHLRALVALAAVSALAACGEDPFEQGLYGAGAGAGAALLAQGDVASAAALGAMGNVAYCQFYKGAGCR